MTSPRVTCPRRRSPFVRVGDDPDARQRDQAADGGRPRDRLVQDGEREQRGDERLREKGDRDDGRRHVAERARHERVADDGRRRARRRGQQHVVTAHRGRNVQRGQAIQHAHRARGVDDGRVARRIDALADAPADQQVPGFGKGGATARARRR